MLKAKSRKANQISHLAELSMSGFLRVHRRLTLSLQLRVALQAFQRELVHVRVLSRALRLLRQALCHLVDVTFVFDGE